MNTLEQAKSDYDHVTPYSLTIDCTPALRDEWQKEFCTEFQRSPLVPLKPHTLQHAFVIAGVIGTLLGALALMLYLF